MTNSKPTPSLYSYGVILIVALGSFAQSYLSCVIAGSLLFISEDFHLSPSQEGHIASIILLGALSGSFLAGSAADLWGRRPLVGFASLIYLFSSLFVFLVPSYLPLLLLRFFTGLGIGITSLVIPLYLGEIAPDRSRGAFVTAYQISLTAGTLAAYGGNYALQGSGDWRRMLALGSIPALLQLCTLFLIPETPHWLFRHSQREKGEKVVEKLQGTLEEISTEDPPNESNQSWKDLLNPIFKKGLFIGFILSIFQQLSGINAIIFFTPKIFQEAGISDPMLSTFMVGIINIGFTSASFFLVDRWGRKKLILISQGGIFMSLLAIIWGFATQSGWIDLFALFATFGFVAFYSLGIGPVTWVLLSEIYPLSIRAKAMSLMTFTNWLSIYFVVLFFPSLISNMGSSVTFSLFGLFSGAGFFLYLFFVPETKGKNFTEIQKMINSK